MTTNQIDQLMLDHTQRHIDMWTYKPEVLTAETKAKELEGQISFLAKCIRAHSFPTSKAASSFLQWLQERECYLASIQDEYTDHCAVHYIMLPPYHRRVNNKEDRDS